MNKPFDAEQALAGMVRAVREWLLTVERVFFTSARKDSRKMLPQHRHGICYLCRSYLDCDMRGVTKMEYANAHDAAPEDPVEVTVFRCADFEAL